MACRRTLVSRAVDASRFTHPKLVADEPRLQISWYMISVQILSFQNY